ncbi:MAG: arginine--tRNA ligase [Pseudomonadota bacterium]
MNLFADIRILVTDALDALVREEVLPQGLDYANVTVEPPRDAAHGDMATNAAMVLAKPAKKKPRDIAEALSRKLTEDTRIASADVAGPGFLNMTLAGDAWTAIVRTILSNHGYGQSTMGQGKRVNVEYVSANPTGPLHVGHTRGAVFGDALASLLDYAGFEVTREYYINDGGAQVDTLARSVYLRYLEAHGQDVAFEDGTYPGGYLVPVGQALKNKVEDAFIGKGEQFWLAEIREFASEAMMDMIRNDLALLGVEMDVFFSEKSLYGTGRIEAALESLEGKGLIYEGVLEPPKGKKPEDWEPREQTLFKSTEHGDDVDRPVKKSDGSWTYFAPDIAYHYDKVERGFDALIDVFGADHGGYVKRMMAAVSALSDGKTPLDIKLTQLVKLLENGEPLKMSKRAGTFVTAADVVDMVGRDAIRFVMLTRKNDAPLDFDVEVVKQTNNDNPVYYVQYAHARVCSVIEKAEAAGMDMSDAALASQARLDHEADVTVAKKLAEWPRLVEIAARTNEPHRIAFYLAELTARFNTRYSMGRDSDEMKFLQEGNTSESQAKIALIRAVAVVLSAGLGILGVTAPKEMR